jgi:hypothetical protein
MSGAWALIRAIGRSQVTVAPIFRFLLQIVSCSLDEGRYIHWPDLDEDLSIAGMVAGRRSGENAESLRKWLAARGGGRG